MKQPTFLLTLALSLSTTVLSLAIPEYNPAGTKNLIPIPFTHPRSLSPVATTDGGKGHEDVALTDGPIWARGEDKFKNRVHPVDSREGDKADGADVVLTDGPIWARVVESVEAGNDVVLTDGPVIARDVEAGEAGNDVVLTDGPVIARGVESGEAGNDVVLTDGPVIARGVEAVEAGNDVVLTDGPVIARGVEVEAGEDVVLTDGPIWAKKDVSDTDSSSSTFDEKEKRVLGIPDCSDPNPQGGASTANDGCYPDAASSVRVPGIFSRSGFIFQFAAMVLFFHFAAAAVF